MLAATVGCVEDNRSGGLTLATDEIHVDLNRLHVRLLERTGAIVVDAFGEDGSVRCFANTGHCEWVEYPEGGLVPPAAHNRVADVYKRGHRDGAIKGRAELARRVIDVVLPVGDDYA